MIIVLIWGLFLTLSFLILNAFQTANYTYSMVKIISKKEQALIFLDSVLWKIAQFLKSDNNNYDSLHEFWAKPLEIETPLGTLQIKIIDLNRFINVNYVGRNKKLTLAFERLLNLLDIDSQLLYRLEVWNGAKKDIPWILPIPPKREPLDSLYEFNYFWNNTKDLYGYNSTTVQKPGLLKFLTVFSNGKININTAPYWVLRSLDPEIDDVLARQIIEARKSKSFSNLMDLLRVEGMNIDLIYRIASLITFKSDYFKIKISLKKGEFSTTLIGIYCRSRNKFLLKKIY